MTSWYIIVIAMHNNSRCLYISSSRNRIESVVLCVFLCPTIILLLLFYSLLGFASTNIHWFVRVSPAHVRIDQAMDRSVSPFRSHRPHNITDGVLAEYRIPNIIHYPADAAAGGSSEKNNNNNNIMYTMLTAIAKGSMRGGSVLDEMYITRAFYDIYIPT